jgi:hypothetical protein
VLGGEAALRGGIGSYKGVRNSLRDYSPANLAKVLTQGEAIPGLDPNARAYLEHVYRNHGEAGLNAIWKDVDKYVNRSGNARAYTPLNNPFMSKPNFNSELPGPLSTGITRKQLQEAAALGSRLEGPKLNTLQKLVGRRGGRAAGLLGAGALAEYLFNGGKAQPESLEVIKK